jgi:DNA-binding LacI/PurR family transcriptional regulator
MEHELFSFSATETTIQQDWAQLIAAAFDTLEKIRKKIPVQDVSIPYCLIERGSVAALTGNNGTL